MKSKESGFRLDFLFNFGIICKTYKICMEG